MRRILLLPVVVTALFVAAGCGEDSGGVPTNAVAVVGKQTVTKSELDLLLDHARVISRESRRPFPKPGTAPYAQIQGQLVQFLVQRAQLAAEADARGIEVTDGQVEKKRKLIVDRYFGGNENLYRKQLEKNGSTVEQAHADIEAALIQEALFGDIGKDVKVSDAEMRRYYQKNKRKYSPRPYGQVKQAVREELLRKKKNEATSKYLLRLARKDNVTYQVGFGPRA